MGWMDLLGSAIGAAGSVAGSMIGADAARDASRENQEASNEAIALYRQMYEQGRADQEPWRRAGISGLAQYQQLLNDPSLVTQQPGYQFGLDQGRDTINQNAATGRTLQSGRTLKALDKYGQDYAQGQYQNLLNRYASVAGLGQSANAANQNAAANYASGAGGALGAAGQARASGYLGQAAAINQGIQGVGNAVTGGINNYLLRQALGGA